MRKWKLLLVALPCHAVSAFAAASPWIDDQGTVSFSDTRAAEHGAEASRLPSNVSPAPPTLAQAGAGILGQKEVPERWGFFFDSDRWHLGYQATNSRQAVREYVVQGETVQNWRKLVTSSYSDLDISLKTYFQAMTQSMSQRCPTLNISMIEETEDTIIFETDNDGCEGHPAQRTVFRIARGRPGILSLWFTEKRPYSDENRDLWLSILKAAVVLESPSQGQRPESSPASRSLPASALGALPSNESSEYLETFGTGILVDSRERVGRLTITLKPTRRLPLWAYLEVHFENPANPTDPIVVGETWQGRDDKVVVGSPPLKGIKCWNYEVVVYVYQDRSKSTLLGTHHQRIQSKVNLEKANFDTDLQAAMTGSSCP